MMKEFLGFEFLSKIFGNSVVVIMKNFTFIKLKTVMAD